MAQSPDYTPAPKSPDKALSSVAFRAVGSLFVGFIVASILERQNYSSPAYWLTLLGSSIIASLMFFYIRHQWFLPESSNEVVERDKGRLTDSITSSRRSAYAISSNWLDLWRSPTFRYYLHLDAVMSMIAYSSHLASPLSRLSDDEDDRKEFFDEGINLVESIGRGEFPDNRHRLRLLIYPEWVYNHASDEVTQLIKSHSAARIPCLPLIAEVLYGALGEEEKETLDGLVAGLGQDGSDKVPPVSRVTAWRDGRALKKGRTPAGWPPVFPDMLLIDSQFANVSTAAVWWYSKEGNVRHWDARKSERRTANQVFASICSHAKGALWDHYSVRTLGSVALTADTTGLGSEAFFAQPYYRKWLKWIQANAKTNRSARVLDDWLSLESRHVEEFVSAYENDSGQPCRILDLGCGFGRHLIDLSRNHSTLLGLGIDINAGMVAEANRSAKQAGIEHRCTFIPGDVSRLSDCDAGEFDLAICTTNTLGNMPDRKQSPLIQRLREVLRPGGKVLISVYAPASVGARLESYAEIGLYVEEKGKRIVAVEGLESEAFEPQDLSDLIEQNGLRVVGQPEQVTSVGWRAIAERIP